MLSLCLFGMRFIHVYRVWEMKSLLTFSWCVRYMFSSIECTHLLIMIRFRFVLACVPRILDYASF